MFARILSQFALEFGYVQGKLSRDSRPSRVMSYMIIHQSLQVRKIQHCEERDPRMIRLMDCSLIDLIYIGLITITTMALAIVPSSHLTHVGWHGNTITWCTLTMWGYKDIIRRVSRFLIPIPMR